MLSPLIVLIGACLVAWGAHAPLVNIPVLGDAYLFNINQVAAWTLCILSALTVPLVWLRKRALALTTVVATLVTLMFLLHALGTLITKMGNTGTVSNVESVLRDTRALSGALFLGGGLLIQLLGIMFRSQPSLKKRQLPLVETC